MEIIPKEESLISRFNHRDSCAWEEVYETFYTDMVFYARKLYYETPIEARDVVQDVFLKMWSLKKVKFETIQNVKAYLYVSVKNSFLDYIEHNKSIVKYKDAVISTSVNFTQEVIRTEIGSILESAVKLLPKEIAEVFQMIAEGYEVKEIAEKLNKPQSTIYLQRQTAIDILKKKMPPDQFIILLIISYL